MVLYDVLIPYHEKDCSILPFCVQGLKHNANDIGTIYIVSETDPEIEDTVWVPEATLPFSKEDVASYIKCPTRVGWYFQQLIKLYAYRYLKSERILIFDSDIIMLKPVTFFLDNKICFSMGDEHHEPYFTHLKKLIPGIDILPKYSGICHHMMTYRPHMEKLLTHIEEVHGLSAWKALLSLVEPEYHSHSGMADYEIYFNYCLTFFPDAYFIRIIPIDSIASLHEIHNSTAPIVSLHSWTNATNL